MTNTRDYFAEKKPWSETKDDIIACYLPAFFQKVFSVRSNVLYIDGFAGVGEYKDSSKGSPLIAMEKATIALGQARSYHPKVGFILAESHNKRLELLQESVNTCSSAKRFAKSAIYSRDFAEAVRQAGSAPESYGTYFFYVDPFGIVDLDCSTFELISRLNGNGNSGVEVLLNFSSVGFLREAYCVRKLQANIPEDVEDSDEGFSGSVQERSERLTKILGGPEWTDVLNRVALGSIDFWSAEQEISAIFKTRLSGLFSYVIDMPIRDMSKGKSRGGLIKYRMLHMTNHWQGCTTMNDVMVKREEDKQSKPHLFAVDVNHDYVDDEKVQTAYLQAIQSFNVSERFAMGKLGAVVIASMGVMKKTNQLSKQHIEPLIDSGVLERVVKLTPKTGKPKKSFDDKDMLIRLK